MKRISSSLLFCFFLVVASAQLTLKVNMIPVNTPDDSNIHVAGTFNGWEPGNPDFILQPNNDGILEITVEPPAGEVKYKFTRGDWDSVEGNGNGTFLPDRVFDYDGTPTTIDHTILSWEDLGGGNSGEGTAASNVLIYDEDFYIPQLNRNRRIWIYLPPDYASSNKAYPVLYMHDAQNLFDVTTSFSGEWEVDESLNNLFDEGDDGIIVVGIDNGGANRLSELTPWSNPQYGGGDGEQYVNFIVETLKPHIDAVYRTQPERASTGIMGSSLGGLISMYAIIEHQDVFSKAGVFSPSFWFSDEAYNHVTTTGKEADVRIYLLAGEQESTSMVPNLNAMYNTLLDAGFGEDELFLITHSDGQHSEWYWAREFPDAYVWLFANSATTSTDQTLQTATIQLSPNPTDSLLLVKTALNSAVLNYQIFDLEGRIVLKGEVTDGGSIDLSAISGGVYITNLYIEKKLVHSEKISKQ